MSRGLTDECARKPVGESGALDGPGDRFLNPDAHRAGNRTSVSSVSEYVLNGPDISLEMPVVPATDGESGIDASKLLATTGHVALDGGFVNTASCTSAITYIDGNRGILRYRGYPIEQLAEKSSYLETSYLLIYGELPTPEQLADFDSRLRMHTILHEDLRRFFDGFPRDAHPMPVLSSAVSALSTFYQDSLDPFDDAR